VSRFQEVGVLAFDIQVLRAQVSLHRHPRFEFDNLSIYELHASLAGHGYAVIAVAHEVNVAHLVQLHRREVDVLVMRLINPLPAKSRVRLRRQESAVEVPVAIYAAHDLGYGHGLDTTINLAMYLERGLHLVEGEQFVAVTKEQRGNFAQEGPPSRVGKIGVNLALEWTIHLQTEHPSN